MRDSPDGAAKLDAVPAEHGVMLIGDAVAVAFTAEEAFVLADDLRAAAEAALRRRDQVFADPDRRECR